MGQARPRSPARPSERGARALMGRGAWVGGAGGWGKGRGGRGGCLGSRLAYAVGPGPGEKLEEREYQWVKHVEGQQTTDLLQRNYPT